MKITYWDGFKEQETEEVIGFTDGAAKADVVLVRYYICLPLAVGTLVSGLLSAMSGIII